MPLKTQQKLVYLIKRNTNFIKEKINITYNWLVIWVLWHINLFCCIVMNNYTSTCRNIFNTIKTSGHSSLEKYTSHFIETLCVRGRWRPNKDCNILTPKLFWLSLSFFPVLLGCSTGSPASPRTWFSFQHFLSN